MNDLSPTEKLSNIIAILEVKQRMEYNTLKDQFETTLDSFVQPENILSYAFQSFTSTTENKSGILNSLLVLVTGIVSSKLLGNKSDTILKKFAGFGIQYISNKFFSKK